MDVVKNNEPNKTKEDMIYFIYKNLQTYNKYLNFDVDKEFKNYVIYNDSDSMFIYLDEVLKETKLSLHDVINYLQNEVNNNILHKFALLHNIDYSIIDKSNYLLPFEFKNEFYLKRMILYAKKKYIGIIKNIETGDLIIEIKGLEGKKTTSKLIKFIVDDFISKIIDDNFDLSNFYKCEYYFDLIVKIKKYINEYSSIRDVINLIAEPIKKNKNYIELKSIQSHSKGMIIFDYYFDKKNNTQFWLKYSGKGLSIPIQLKKFNSNKFINTYNLIKNTEALNIIEYMKKYIDLKEYDIFIKYVDDFIKTYDEVYIKALNSNDEELIKKISKNRNFKKITNYIDKYISKYIQSITLPELLLDDNIVINIFKDLNFEIDYSKLFSKVYKKIDIFYKPFLSISIKTDKKTLSDNLDNIYEDDVIFDILKNIFTSDNKQNTNEDDFINCFIDDNTNYSEDLL